MKSVGRCVLLCVVFVSSALPAADLPVVQPDDEIGLVKVGTPAVSPDGRWIAYSVSRYCPKLEERVGDIFLVPLTGGEPRQLTNSPNRCQMG